MDKNLFFEAIKTKVLNTLHEDNPSLTATLTTVTKTNNTLYHALSFKSDANNMQPVIYLDGYYEQFSDGKITLEDATSLIISLYRDSILPDVNVNFMQNFESIKDKVIPCIFNTASNTSMLQDLVHKDFLDLSVCYLVLVDLPDRINGSVKVTNKLLETWASQKKLSTKLPGIIFMPQLHTLLRECLTCLHASPIILSLYLNQTLRII